MSTSFRDSSGKVRLVGTIYAPGATVGDVFTVQADGSLAPAPGGGSQPGAVTVLGPYHVGFADIPNLNDSMTLFTPSAGEVILACWPNPRTMTQFADGVDNSPIIVVGQDSEIGDDAGAAIVWAEADADLIHDQIAIGSGRGGPGGANLYPTFGGYSASAIMVTPMHPLAEAVVCKYLGYEGESDLTAGAVDWYFAVCTPDAP